jgi:glycosyltransferase involved in cell wall biosynthesis
MGKTLAVIINHNRKEYTDRLYKSLNAYTEQGNYDLYVFDNGSTDPKEVSEFTSFSSEENTYYGGALNIIFAVMLENQQYDSLMVLNNDIILHPYKFVETFRKTLFDENYHILSPSVLQPEEGQCFWPQMHNWGQKEVRQAKWVDFMCPIFKREFVEEIKEYDTDMIYGWGQDVYSGIVCEKKNWKVGVLDRLAVIHMSAQTYKDSKSDINMSEYSQRATQGMHQFFHKVQLVDKLQEFRSWGMNYKYKEV